MARAAGTWRDHVEDRPDVLRHPAVDEDQALGQRTGQGRGNGSSCRLRPAEVAVLPVQEAVRRQQPAAADAPFRVSFRRGNAFDQLDAGEDPPRVLPAASRAAQPLAQDRPRHHHLASSGSSGPVRFAPGRSRASASVISEASRLVETASREPLGMSLTLLTISSPCPGRTIVASRSASRYVRSLEGRGDQSPRRPPPP